MLASAILLLGSAALAFPVLADDGGVMQRAMGHEAYAGMVEHMSGVLGEERAREMLAQCDAAMAAHEAEGSGALHTGG